MKAAAPGKIILSGEHAVVHGKPALALAVDCYVTTTITAENRPGILLDFADLNHRTHLNTAVLNVLKAQIKNKYERFKRGDFSIRKVLSKPFELAQFAIGTVAETLNLSLPHGIKIHIQSDLPIGCGMGSSAAAIVSVMYAVSQYLHKPLLEDQLFRLALDAENMQHGASSGIDLRASLNGGCLFFANGTVSKRELPVWPLYLVNTGLPLTSTGQCVSHTSPYFKQGTLAEDFSAVTQAMDQSLVQHSFADFCAAVRHNHQLLMRIGVVPQTIQSFIADLEACGAAAKICGAGAVAGESAGMVLIAAQDQDAVQAVTARYHYEMQRLHAAKRGVHVI